MSRLRLPWSGLDSIHNDKSFSTEEFYHFFEREQLSWLVAEFNCLWNRDHPKYNIPKDVNNSWGEICRITFNLVYKNYDKAAKKECRDLMESIWREMEEEYFESIRAMEEAEANGAPLEEGDKYEFHENMEYLSQTKESYWKEVAEKSLKKEMPPPPPVPSQKRCRPKGESAPAPKKQKVVKRK